MLGTEEYFSTLEFSIVRNNWYCLLYMILEGFFPWLHPYMFKIYINDIQI